MATPSAPNQIEQHRAAQRPHGQHSTGQHPMGQHGMMQMSYGHFAAMVGTATAVMLGLMYSTVYRWGDVWWSQKLCPA